MSERPSCLCERSEDDDAEGAKRIRGRSISSLLGYVIAPAQAVQSLLHRKKVASNAIVSPTSSSLDSVQNLMHPKRLVAIRRLVGVESLHTGTLSRLILITWS